MLQLLEEYSSDLYAFLASVALVVAYYCYLIAKVRQNPTYTIHGVNALARKLWVEKVMGGPGHDVMAVQTLRNFIMGSTLMASTASLLIIGTLTLSGQADNISKSWHVLNMVGSYSAQIWIIKVIALLLDFIIAFFSFAMAVRLLNHVVFMINVPEHGVHAALSPPNIARRLIRAGNLFAIGMRAFFFAVPLVFWLFGPTFLMLATMGLVIALYHLDRSKPNSPGST